MNRRLNYKIITILIPISILLLYWFHGYILQLLLLLPSCPFYQLLDLYCPACGNTRSVTALLRGDLLSSLRFNIVPILLITMGCLAYIELATFSFGKHLRLLPRTLRFYLTMIVILLVYMILRNFAPYLTP